MTDRNKLWDIPYRMGRGEGLVEALQLLHNTNDELIGQERDGAATLILQGRIEAALQLAAYVEKHMEAERDKA